MAEFEVESEELAYRTRMAWFMEKHQDTPISDSNPEVEETDEVDEHGISAWMIASSTYDERDSAISTMAFHERKYPEDRQRIVRIETRHYVEYITDEELQKWHDKAAKGDKEKAARASAS